MCTRCVRFCREIAGTSELMVINLGAHEEIDIFPGYPLDNKLSGNVVDLCPVGALGDKDFLYSQRVWFMKSHPHVCGNCSTGCSIKVDENQDQVFRLRPRPNPHINQWWMCDEGRYGWKYVHSPERLIHARSPAGDADWSMLIPELQAQLTQAKRLAAVLSPFQTVEEAYLLAKYIRHLDEHAIIATGYVPAVGEDERFPTGFTIHAEKCPNRRGIEKIASQIMGELITWPDFLTRCQQDDAPEAVWFAGGYPTAWSDAEVAKQFARQKLLIVQEVFPSALGQRADYQLPAATVPEREGSFVNFADRLQSFPWAIRPPAGVYTDGQLFWRLLEEPGLYRHRPVLDEIALNFAYFAAASEPAPEVGVDLRVNLLAQKI
jgi:NADH-quinone oxidoreductase subunit G